MADNKVSHSGSEFSYIDYLEVKKTIDDDALNPHVFDQFRDHVNSFPMEKSLSVLELGAGTGTMIERLLDRNVFHSVKYTAVDIDTDFLSVIPRRLQRYARQHRWKYEEKEQSTGHPIYQMRQTSKEWTIIPVKADLFQFTKKQHDIRQWDILLAHAVLDLVPIPETLPQILSLLKSSGAYYFTLNYDGVTKFLPALNPELDTQFETIYNETMDTRTAGGKPIAGAKSGSLLLTHLQEYGAQISACGSSDWIVHPGDSGYALPEKIFLKYILNTFNSALWDHAKINKKEFDRWMEKRITHLDQKKLSFIAHQLDFFGQVCPPN